MNVKSSLQASAIFTGVVSMYVGPLLAFAVSNRPPSVAAVDEPVRVRKVQFYFEDHDYLI